ncbi:MAG: SLBB domain-containing protein, partial [Panacagrimonas sp.]
LVLHSRDQLIAFPAEGSREDLMERVIEELRHQAGMTQEAQIVDISGRVKAPGTYPLTAPMTVSDLIRAAGGGSDDAYPREVEITRRSVVDGERREITRYVVDLSDPQAAATPLWPYDTVNVRPIQGWNKTEVVTLRGEVRLPGEYVIQPNETMDSVIRRAGGFTPQAYLPGTVFSREEIRRRQQEELERQGKRLRAELLQVQLDYQGPDRKEIDIERVRQLGALLAEELNDAQALGRVVVDMGGALDGSKPVTLRGGDTITVPRQPSEVTVLGEVSYPTTHLFQEGSSYRDYLELSGGYSARADKGSAFVVRINGEVSSLDRAKVVMPGDVVIVPFKVDRGRALYITATLAQIIGQLAITAASFKTIGVF